MQPKQKEDRQICKYYLNNSCKNGHFCTFRHPERQKESAKYYPSNNHASSQQTQYDSETKRYLEALMDSMKKECLNCKELTMPIYISCGCSSLCEQCVLKQAVCKPGHKYGKVFIK